MMLSRAAAATAAILLSAADFHRERHRIIFDAILRLDCRSQPADPVSMAEELKRHSDLERSGGQDYLLGVAADVGTSAHIEHHAGILLDLSTRRRAIALADGLRGDALDGTTEISGRLEWYSGELAALSTSRSARERFALVWDVIDGLIERVMSGEQAVRVVRTGFPSPAHGHSPTPFDAKLGGGLATKRMSLLVAPPSFGKTSLATQLAATSACLGNRVGYFCLEDGSESIAALAEAQLEGLSTRWHYADGQDRPSRDRLLALREQNRRRGGIPYRVESLATPTVQELIGAVRAMKRRFGLDLAIVDYLSAMDYSARNYQADVAEILKRLAGFALQEDVHLMVLHHLNKEIEYDRQKRDGRRGDAEGVFKRPRLTDIGLTSATYRYAFYVFALHCPMLDPEAPSDLYHNGKDWRNRAELGVLKHKETKRGWRMPLKMIADHRKFSHWEEDDYLVQHGPAPLASEAAAVPIPGASGD